MVSGEWRVVNGEVSGECGEWWVVSDGSGWAQVVQITPVVQVLSMDLISSAVDLHFASGTRLDTGIRRTPGRIVASGGGGRREISAERGKSKRFREVFLVVVVVRKVS